MALDANIRKANADVPVLSRGHIETLIAQGQHIVIVDGVVLKCDAWMPYHPGGDKAIKHMVGRDATDEVTAFHSPEALQRMQRYRIGRIEGRWKNFLPPIQGGTFKRQDNDRANGEIARPIPVEDDSDASSVIDQDSEASSVDLCPVYGRSTLRARQARHARYTPPSSVSSLDLEEIVKMTHLDRRTQLELDRDLSLYPAAEPDVQDEVIRQYRLLNQRIKDEGLYQCNYQAYAVEGLRYLALFSISMYFLSKQWYTISAVFLGLFWHQLVFSAHDAGHMGITHDFHLDSVIGILITDFLGGLSLGWWKSNHNVHHVVTNAPEHDPDIQHLPFFAVSHRFLTSLRSTYYDFIMTYDLPARSFVRIQHYLYYIVLAFGRFNLYRLSWNHLLFRKGPKKGPAWWHWHLEVLGHVFFWSWYGYGIMYKGIPTNWQRFTFFMISHFVTSPVHVQITLSHFGMSTADLGVHESFPQKMLRTTMDVDCPPWLDFIHGGLQFQVIHHLFPRIPRHNLRRTQKLIQEFCEQVNIPYALYGFVHGNQQVVGRLAEIARQASILKACQNAMIEHGDFGVH